MTIIQIEPLESGQHPIQSQSHRRACWVEGYIEVPVHLEAAVWATYGWCDLQIEGGVLVGITPTERRAWRKLWRRLMKPLSRSLRAGPNRNLSTHSRTMRCWIYMKC